MSKTNKMIYMAMLIALEIVLTRFLSIQTPIVRIGFGYIPVAIAGALLGPLLAGTMAATADIIRMFLFPSGFPYFPGFTLSAFVGGAIYGVFFYKKQMSMLRAAIAVAVITIMVSLLMNTYWVHLTSGKAVLAVIGARLTTTAIMFPIQTILIYTVINLISRANIIHDLNNV